MHCYSSDYVDDLEAKVTHLEKLVRNLGGKVNYPRKRESYAVHAVTQDEMVKDTLSYLRREIGI